MDSMESVWQAFAILEKEKEDYVSMTIHELINQVTDAVEYGCRYIPAEEKDSIICLVSQMAHALMESNACGHALTIALGYEDNRDADIIDLDVLKKLENKGTERLYSIIPLPVFSAIMSEFMYAEDEKDENLSGFTGRGD